MNLVGDIGGTKTLLALAVGGDPPVFQEEKRFPSQKYGSLDEVITSYLDRKEIKVQSACFAVAGPVIRGRCQATNLPWIVDTRNLESTFGFPRVSLINDLESTAMGCLGLMGKDLHVLNSGRSYDKAHRAVIAAGTGLGEGILFWEGTRYRPMASEGGHTDFAPRNKQEIQLLEFLMRQFGHVSYERVLSGPGLVNLYTYFRDSGLGTETEWVAGRMAMEDPAAVITECGLSRKDDLCTKALTLFVSLYGAEAGNLALKSLATGGVYVAGGIAPKILAKIQEGGFMSSFVDKGRYGDLLKDVPVWVVLNEKTALIGAGRVAHQLASEADQ